MAAYGTDDGLTNWLLENGYAVPDGSQPMAVLRSRGSAYVDGVYGDRFTGLPSGGILQDLAWPRTGATAFGEPLPVDLIPQRVINASYEAALVEALKPGSLTVRTDPAKRVKRQKVEGIEREFFEPGDTGTSAAPILTSVEGLIAPLLRPIDVPVIGLWSVGC